MSNSPPISGSPPMTSSSPEATTIRVNPSSVNVVDPITVDNAAPGELGEEITVQTNIFGIIMKGEVHVHMYDIRISAEYAPGRTVEFTKKAKDDCLVNERREKCVIIFNTLMEKNLDFFNDKYKNYYDGQSLLFSIVDLFGPTKEQKPSRLFILNGTDLPGELSTLPTVHIEVKGAQRAPFLFGPTTLVSQTANSDLRLNDHIYAQFMEVVLNQYAVMNPNRHKVFEQGKTFMCNPAAEGFTERETPKVGDGKVLIPGTQKSVKQIEGPRGRGTNNPSIFIDAKKVAFHAEINCADKIMDITGGALERELPARMLDKVNGVLKGLFVQTSYLNKIKTMQIMKIARTTAVNTKFDTPDGAVTVAEYFAKKYNINLKYPNAPLLVVFERGRHNCYPVELCKVAPFQRVTIAQQTPSQSKLTTKECAVSPLMRQAGIVKGAKALELLNDENTYITNAGMEICKNPLKATARALKGANVQYLSSTQKVEEGKWSGRGQKYLVPAKCPIWAAYLVYDGQQPRRELFPKFVNMFYNLAVSKGMQLGNGPTEIEVLHEKEVHERMKVAAEHKCEYVLFVVADELDAIHSHMKLWERETLMVTQHVKTSNMVNVAMKNKMMTLENIVNKTNCKLGGLNYGLDMRVLNGVARKWFSEERLYIGVSISHPPPTGFLEKEGVDVPAVVGFAANTKPNIYEIVGDYVFQDPRQLEVLASLPYVVETAYKQHQQSHHGEGAKEIIIYRAGIDEGGFAAIISREVPILRRHMQLLGATPKIVYIIANKEHNLRIMKTKIDPKEANTQQNIPAGIVLDVTVTHPSFKEFYLNSHTTLQGTARTPRYTVLVDDLKLDMDEIEGFTYSLAHDHQIVSLTTSLPAPLYIAQRYSERGRMLCGEYAKKEGSSSGSSSGQWDDYNKQLTHTGTKFEKMRVNA